MGKPRNLELKIKELRDKKYSYSQICEELNCAKSTVAYHLGNNEKRNSGIRGKRYREDTWYRKLNNWNLDFMGRNWFRKGTQDRQKTLHLLKEYLKDELDNKCYLSGRELDFNNIENIHFDHKVPKSKGGNNNLDNLGICTKEANQSKSDLSIDEYLELCKDVLEYNDYTVKKN
jgi:CRISPR/Cas system Type II protein with McrA/HNH and RuvC-like nuclease domain